MKHHIVLAAALPLLAGCTRMGPDFAAPEAWWKPTSWFAAAPAAPPAANASVPVAEPFDPHWWKVFADPLLDEMQTQLATANLDLRTADFRLAEARAQLGITEAASSPGMNLNSSYTRQQQSRRGTSATATSATTNPAILANGLGGRTSSPNTRLLHPYDLFQVGFDLSWEIDLWGRVARLVEASEAQVAASEEARRDLLVTASAELARSYIVLRGVQRKAAIVRQNLDIARQNLALTRRRAAGGLTTDLDVANASTQVATVEAQLPTLEEQQARLVNAISLLLGEQPGARLVALAAPRALPPVPPRVPVGVPGELTRRRPDIRMAEANLHVATAVIGVAKADFFPRVILSGSGALQGLNFKNLGEWASQTYGFGPSVTLPIFEGGRLRRTLELREAQQQEAALIYQRTVLTALHEVDNALTAYGTEQRRRDRIGQAVAEGRRALALARLRYEEGVSDFLQVLTAQRALLAAEQDHADSTTTVSLNLVQLYRALGGGWDPATAASPAASPAAIRG
ncbi:MAG: efflux transporter outer membrane subunit [Acetobacteraceae bacterium]|nr:efflux transporter outer membrane subunit [Acetobacteraceae bacterium]